MPTCPACKATLESKDLVALSVHHGMIALMKNWRFWAVIVPFSATSSIIGGLSGFQGVGSAVGGGMIGLVAVLWSQRLRRCPKCDKIGAFKPSEQT